MNSALVDTQAMSAASAPVEAQTPPTTTIPEITPIGDRAALEAAPEDALTDKFMEYEAAAPILVEHHDYQRERFDAVYVDYVRIFTGLATLDSIKQSTEAVAPGFDLFEEFELVNLPDSLDSIIAKIGKLTLYGGAGASLFAFYKAGMDSRKAAQALSLVKGKPIGAAQPPAAVKAAKNASRWKVLGVVGAALTVGSAAVGIIASIENAKRRRAFIVDAVETYQNWYATTRQGIHDFAAGTAEMEDAIDEMLDLLGFKRAADLVVFLDGSLQVAGELQGALKTATRMLCASPPLNPTQVVTFTGLPAATIQRRAALIAANPNICSLGG